MVMTPGKPRKQSAAAARKAALASKPVAVTLPTTPSGPGRSREPGGRVPRVVKRTG